MRVVMLVAKHVSYDARVRRSARSLAAHGYDVTIACGSVDGERSEVMDPDGYRVLQTPIVIRKRKAKHERPLVFDDKPYRIAWRDLLRADPPDVVHVHDHQGLGAAIAVAGPRTCVIYDAHEYVLGKVNGARRQEIGSYLRGQMPRVDGVITVGTAIAEVLAAGLDLPSPPVAVHNVPSLRDARPAPYDLRDAAGIDAETPLLVYTGTVTKRRRLETPIQALAGLPGVHLALVLIEDKGVPELKETAERLGVGSRVHFPPPVPHDALVSLIRTADAGLIPLERYQNGDLALPNKLFEYLHAGLPMIASDCPELARFVREHRLGEIAPVDDWEAWARAGARILADPAAYQSPERPDLCRRWSWETEETALLDLYERVVGARREEGWYDHVFASSEQYRRPYAETTSYERWDVAARRLRELGAASVLDIGCGPGQFAALLRDSGLTHYLGIDFSPVAIERAREVCPEFEFRVEDARTSDAYETFPHDAVVCLEALEHIDEDREVVRRIRPGTRVIATVPDFDAPAHVRHFATEDEVRERYGDLLLDLSVTRQPFGKRSIFTLEGVRGPS